MTRKSMNGGLPSSTTEVRIGSPDGVPNWFHRHPRTSMLLIYAFLAGFFLAGDLAVSNIRKSTLELQMHTVREPIGHGVRPGFSGYYGVRFWDEFKAPFTFNNLGFRNDFPFDPAGIADKTVIIAMGDSTTIGLEVPAHAAYPAVLGRALGTHVVVFNAGVRAYDTQQVLLDYLVRVRPLQPDAVVYLICPNDYNNNVRLAVDSEYVQYFGKGVFDETMTVRYVAPTRPGPTWIDRSRVRFKRNFNLTSYAVQQLARLARFDGAASPTWGAEDYYTPETMRTMERLLRRFDAETARDGVRLYLAYMPEFEHDPRTVRETQMYRAYAGTRDFARAHLPNTVFIPTFDLFLSEMADRPDRPRFSFRRDPHANVHGNRWLGETIAQRIREDLPEDGGRRPAPGGPM